MNSRDKNIYWLENILKNRHDFCFWHCYENKNTYNTYLATFKLKRRLFKLYSQRILAVFSLIQDLIKRLIVPMFLIIDIKRKVDTIVFITFLY